MATPSHVGVPGRFAMPWRKIAAAYGSSGWSFAEIRPPPRATPLTSQGGQRSVLGGTRKWRTRLLKPSRAKCFENECVVLTMLETAQEENADEHLRHSHGKPADDIYSSCRPARD